MGMNLRIHIIAAILFFSSWAFAQPSLLPLPQELKWNNESFLLSSCKAIVIDDPAYMQEGKWLQGKLRAKGFDIPITEKAPHKGASIVVKSAQLPSPAVSREAYRLIINRKSVLIEASSATGVFYA